MKTSLTIVASLVLLAFLIVGCKPPDKAQPAAQPTATPAPATPAARASDWDNTVLNAKKEGRVVVFGVAQSWAAATTSVSGAFKNRYGIDVEFTTGFPAGLSERLLRERRAGIYNVDVNLTGPQSAFGMLKAADMMERLDPILVLPEVRDPNQWLGGRLNWLDQEHTFLGMGVSVQPKIAYNTNLVTLEEIRTLKDLLNPKWKGKIVIQDPMTPGVGNMGVKGIGTGRYGFDFFKELVKQEPVITADSRQQAEWIAREKYAIAMFAVPGLINDLRKSGAPVKMMIPDDSFVSAAGTFISVVKDAPHPNAARLFTNWFLTKEGQMTYVAQSQTASGRLDVPNGTLLDPAIAPVPDAK